MVEVKNLAKTLTSLQQLDLSRNVLPRLESENLLQKLPVMGQALLANIYENIQSLDKKLADVEGGSISDVNVKQGVLYEFQSLSCQLHLAFNLCSLNSWPSALSRTIQMIDRHIDSKVRREISDEISSVELSNLNNNFLSLQSYLASRNPEELKELLDEYEENLGVSEELLHSSEVSAEQLRRSFIGEALGDISYLLTDCNGSQLIKTINSIVARSHPLFHLRVYRAFAEFVHSYRESLESEDIETLELEECDLEILGKRLVRIAEFLLPEGEPEQDPEVYDELVEFIEQGSLASAVLENDLHALIISALIDHFPEYIGAAYFLYNPEINEATSYICELEAAAAEMSANDFINYDEVNQALAAIWNLLCEGEVNARDMARAIYADLSGLPRRKRN